MPNKINLIHYVALSIGSLSFGWIGKAILDRIVSKIIKRSHPEKICALFEMTISTQCNWIIRRSTGFNDSLEALKRDFPDSGKMVEDQIIGSLERIRLMVDDTSKKVIANLKK